MAELEPVVRRFLARRVFDPHRLDDLVQETLARLVAARPDLEGETLVAYAVVAARNVLASDSVRTTKRGHLERRHVDLRQPEQPDAVVLAGERREALEAALSALSEEERRSLLAHELEGVDTASLAEEARSTPGAVAARLARARAKLRVDYVLALRRVELPTAKCRPVLEALSAGDRRRQASVGAADHLLSCTMCPELAPALVERRPALAAVMPLAIAGRFLGGLPRWVRSHPGPAAVTGAAAGAAVATALWLAPDRPPAPPTCPPVVGPGGTPLPLSAGSPPGLVGAAVEGRAVTVASVPAAEGFWASCGQGQLWVQLVGPGESQVRVSPGRRVAFRGVVVPHGPDFASRAGVDPAEGAAELTRLGYHVEVPYPEVREAPR